MSAVLNNAAEKLFWHLEESLREARTFHQVMGFSLNNSRGTE